MSAVAGNESDNLSAAGLRIRAVVLFERREFERALEPLDAYLSHAPRDREILNIKARALESLGRLDEALDCVNHILKYKPNDTAELCNRATLLIRLSRREEALGALETVLSVDPRRADVLVKRAYLLYQLARPAEALESAERAVRIAPEDLEALNTRGMILEDLGHGVDALADFEKILSIDPNYANAITNCAVHYGRAGRFREAMECYERSLSINPDQPGAFYNRAVIRLVLGDWPRGFAEFESRWKLFPHEAARLTRLAPMWTGKESLVGKTILLHHEQGYGDTLQFCRYTVLVKQLGARVILATPVGLLRLMSTLPGSPETVSEGQPTPAHDFHCPMMSLPLAFGTTPSNVPAQVPYLHGLPGEVIEWNKRLGPRRRPRIGVVWRGRSFPPINYARDLPFESIRSLFALDADFICLQTDMTAGERAQLSSLPNGILLTENLVDFADTAAVIENLDLVITADTAVAHLAGALRKPVWVMNRYATCWRWLLDRSDSPWYPTLRLFRQSSLGNWHGVVREVLMAAADFIVSYPKDAVQRTAPVMGMQELPVMLQRALDQHNSGQLVDAVASYRGILDCFPNQFDALHYFGVALAQLKRFDEALHPLEQAVNMRPNDAAVLNHYGNALAGLSRHVEAIQSYEKAIACDSQLPDSHYNQGVSLMALGKVEAAVACHTEASRLKPDHAQAYNNRGVVLCEMGKLQEALADYDRAVRVQPKFVDAWVNRSDVLRKLRRFEDALDASALAIGLDAGLAEAHNSRGAVLADLGRWDEALTSYDRAIELNPSSAEAVWNKGLIELSRGHLREGWKRYESRWRVKSLKLKERFTHLPPWRGEKAIAGKVLLLHSEQGYGDTIQFCRFCTEAASLGARIILSAPKALHTLLESLSGVSSVIDQSASEAVDLQCPLMSVPLALGTELHNIPAPVRYLQAAPGSRARWAARIGNHGTPKIGVVWSGRATHNKDPERSLAFHQLLPVLELSYRWVSLQKEIRPSDMAELSVHPGIERMGEELTDFADTAALIECLDLVISVDTAVAHLTAALGKPVWILLPNVSDWRWLQEREDSPWYPSARLFRQSKWGDWTSVIDSVRSNLKAFRVDWNFPASPYIPTTR